jgi:hypothetical protein
MERYEAYRRFARECLEIAPTMDDPKAKAMMVQMAQAWFRLAEEYAKSREREALRKVGDRARMPLRAE